MNVHRLSQELSQKTAQSQGVAPTQKAP
jgi:hypothetical protein